MFENWKTGGLGHLTKLILRSLSFEKTEAVKYRRAGGTDSELLSPRLFFAFGA